MKAAQKLLIIKITHTVIWIFFNIVIGYLCAPVITNNINKWTWVCIGLVFAEGIVLILFRNICPATLFARKYPDSPKANFDIFLPEWSAGNTRRIYTIIVVVAIMVLLWRLINGYNHPSV